MSDQGNTKYVDHDAHVGNTEKSIEQLGSRGVRYKFQNLQEYVRCSLCSSSSVDDAHHFHGLEIYSYIRYHIHSPRSYIHHLRRLRCPARPLLFEHDLHSKQSKTNVRDCCCANECMTNI